MFFRIQRSLLLAAFLILLLCGFAGAQIFPGPGFTVVDGGARVPASCSTVPVSGITANVRINSVSFTNLVHTFIGDTESAIYPPAAAPPPSTAGSIVLASPPDLRPCNFAGNYTYIDSAASSIDAATTGCADSAIVPPGSYRTSTYGGGTANGPVTSFAVTPGVLTPAQTNGNWRVCVFDFISPDGGSAGGTSIEFAPVAAATATVSGRVTGADGRGIFNARLEIAGTTGEPRFTQTNAFGHYRFLSLPTGQMYTLTVDSKRYQFANPSLVINLTADVTNANFTASPF